MGGPRAKDEMSWDCSSCRLQPRLQAALGSDYRQGAGQSGAGPEGARLRIVPDDSRRRGAEAGRMISRFDGVGLVKTEGSSAECNSPGKGRLSVLAPSRDATSVDGRMYNGVQRGCVVVQVC
jgi:hypothetical protein